MKRSSKLLVPAFFALSILAMSGCKKDADLPEVATDEISQVSISTALTGGNVITDGGADITSRGVCWSTIENPTLDEMRTDNGSGKGQFTSYLYDLDPNTTYYVRAYATNLSGTAYGKQFSFKTEALPENNSIGFNENLSYQTVTDIDGNSYRTIEIGPYTWMAENLRTTRLRDGSPIQLIREYHKWRISSSPSYSWYKNDIVYAETYGALYNWFAITSGNLCPSGWHVSTDVEVGYLFENLPGNGTLSGYLLREAGTNHWSPPNDGATNETGWTALPGGIRHEDGIFTDMHDTGYWWYINSWDILADPGAASISFDSNALTVTYNVDPVTVGMSVRCVMHNETK